MKTAAALMMVALLLVRATPASAASCSGCSAPEGGFLSIEGLSPLLAASNATTIVASAFGILAVAGAGGNLVYGAKGERPTRLWAHLSFGAAAASVLIGSTSVALGVNLRNSAADVAPPDAQPGVMRAGNTALAIGLSALGAGIANIGLGVWAMTQPEAETFVTTGSVSVAPMFMLDRGNNVAPGMGARFVIN